MIKYKILTEITRKPVSITCDVCSKEFDCEEDSMEIQEFHYVRISGGYGSIFGDGSVLKADICQTCTQKLLGDYLIEEDPDTDN